MFDFLYILFDTSAFPARWYCGQWTPVHGWTHVLADLGIWSAYTAIPIVLFYFVRRRKDIPFSPIIVLFAAFILFCGFTHLVEASIFWWPVYRFSAVMKVSTAVVSWLTVLALIRIMPAAMGLPGLARVNTELARANHELNDFAYVVSHDLKAPLRGIRSLAEWIETDLKDAPEDTRENLMLIQQRVDKMQQLIDGVLAYSKVGRADVGLVRRDTGEVIQEVLETLELPDNVQIALDASFPTLLLNPTRIHQVFANLLNNAMRYQAIKGGEIHVGCRELVTEWRFHVMDSGPGIPAELKERVFRLFQKLGDETPRSEQSGLGLSIAKKIVETGGGRIWIDSNLGEGCTVYFTIPKEPVRMNFELSGNTLSTGAAASVASTDSE